MEGTIENPFNIENPVYQPELFYKWGKENKEWGVGLAEYRIKGKSYFWITIRGDMDAYYRVSVNKVYEFVKDNPDSVDNPKGTHLLVFPIGKWGKELGLYHKFNLKEYEELRDKYRYYKSQGLDTRQLKV